ncbi:TVP38/TMEM64 family protein [Alkalibacterium sp. MB6]|uniref:TVP38/TMEM64 family protein n=1 Tax=Alkalibacterium sp. MB6 TaxID=2081965 RepID=UPI00137A12AC|nr:VTT domain-containing protein [Alkalibacterium sp. MB6]
MVIAGKKFEWIDILSIIGLIMTAILVLFAWQAGIFESREQFVDYIRGFGVYSVIVFIALQTVQIFLPLLPSAITVPAGVVLYGFVIGNLYNFIGIALGSILSYLAVKRYGERALGKLVSKKKIKKYEDKLTNGKRFERLFIIVMFLPFTPDNIFVYLAGLSDMHPGKVITYILLGKPLSIAIYSLGLTTLLEMIGIL